MIEKMIELIEKAEMRTRCLQHFRVEEIYEKYELVVVCVQFKRCM